MFAEASLYAETTKSPLRTVLRNNWRQLLIVAGFVVLLNVAFYLILGYMPTYLSGQLGHSTAQGNWMLVAVMALMLVAIPPVGALSARIGRKPLRLAAAIDFAVRSGGWGHWGRKVLASGCSRGISVALVPRYRVNPHQIPMVSFRSSETTELRYQAVRRRHRFQYGEPRVAFPPRTLWDVCYCPAHSDTD